MKKLILLGVVMLLIVLVATVPALAQSQGFSERRITSGTSSPKVEIKNTGDNVNACPVAQQIAQTGNVANEQGALPFESKVDDIDFSGSSLTIDGASVTATCDQTINQAAAASK